MNELTQAPFWGAVLQLGLINIVLSGDNAVIIAMACRGLPRAQRLWGIALGAGVGVVLRLAFAVVIAWLLALPHLRLVGGLVLLYIGASLLVRDDADHDRVEAPVRLWHAVWIVLVADIVMSFDNILAMVEIAKDDFVLLAVGLAISIPLVAFGAALVAAVLERLPLLIWAGSALLGWVAGRIIAEDETIEHAVIEMAGPQWSERARLAAACGGVVVVLASGWLWRRWRLSGAGQRSGGARKRGP